MLSTAPSPADTARPIAAGGQRRVPLAAAVPIAAVGGLALDGAFPALAWWPLTFLGVAAGLLTLAGRRVGGALLVGGVFGAVFHLTQLVWVGGFLGPVPWLALATLETALFAVGAAAIAVVYRGLDRVSMGRGRPIIVAAGVATVWTGREVLMGAWPYGGFPWARIGTSQVNGPFAELLSWVGVTGLTFLVVLTSALAVELVRLRSRFRARTISITVMALVSFAVVPQFPTTPAGSIRIGWVQGNGPTAYFDTASDGEILRAQLSATERLRGEDLDLVAWPEGSVDSDPLADGVTASTLDTLSDAMGAPLLINAATQRGENTFNTSLLWQPGIPPQHHDKVNPVPFGERVPDRWFYERIAPQFIDLIRREYTPGMLPPVVTVDASTVGLAICFDVIYDAVIYDGIRDGAEVFVFQTNNADFRGTDENLQQAAIARMRAIETGRAVVNVSTVGTSQVFAPDGAVLDSAAPDTVAAAVADVELRTGTTLAALIGPWISPVVVGLGALTLAVALLYSARTPDATSLRTREKSSHVHA